ncbi:MAG: hypothetical protein ACE5KA_08835, partial [Nitrososphaerales archaeon]
MNRVIVAGMGVCILVLSMIIGPLSVSDPAAFGSTIDSPREQMADGVAAEDVVCKEGLTLMIRGSGTAACVKPSNAMKLVHRGWGTILKEPSTMDEKTKHPSTSPILALVDYTSRTAEDDAESAIDPQQAVL